MSEIIEDPADHWHGVLLYDTLLMIPWFGRTRLRDFNAAAVRRGVNVCAPIGDLPPRARAWVVEWLRGRGL